MRQKIIRRNITDEEKAEAGAIIERIEWTPASSERYRNSPHMYVVKFRPLGITTELWERFAHLIKHCSVARSWRDPSGGEHKYWYLLLDGKCYWVDWPAINCADAASLEPPRRDMA